MSLPSPPSNFLNATLLPAYIFATSQFRAQSITPVSIFRRRLAANFDDLLAALLSVLLFIALVELLTALFLAAPRVSLLRFVCRTDDVRHFRWHRPASLAPLTRRRVVACLLVLFAALFLSALQTFTVYLTRPVRVFSASDAYGLYGHHPAGTTDEISRAVARDTRQMRCVSPPFTPTEQTRHFVLSACVAYEDVHLGDEQPLQTVDTFTVTSYYHDAGSDHNVSYGTSFHTVSTRALVRTEDSQPFMYLQFQNNDNSEKLHARYLQSVMARAAIQSTCADESSSQTCQQALDALTVVESSLTPREINLWQGPDGLVRKRETGVSTTFSANVSRPDRAFRDAVRVFATSSLVKEAPLAGLFLDQRNNKQTGIKNLVSENGRFAGVLLLAIMVAAAMLLLIVLRYFFKPVSLPQLAWRYVRAHSKHAEDEQVTMEEAFVDSYYTQEGESSSSGAKISARRTSIVIEEVRCSQGSYDPSTEGETDVDVDMSVARGLE